MTRLPEPPDSATPAGRRPRPSLDVPVDIAEEAPPFDPDRELWGAVFMVPDRHWDIATARPDHPGACAHYQAGDRTAVLVKGTDADNLRTFHGYFLVGPTDGNGLEKRTGFELVPRPFRVHRLRVYYPERYLGRLDDSTRLALCEELARLHPEE
jgi:hypothetical protein